MATGDLTTLAAVKAHLGLTDSASDAWLGTAISSQSARLVTLLGRPILRATYVELHDGPGWGPGRHRLTLNRYPVIAVAAVTVDLQVTAGAIPGSPYQITVPSTPAWVADIQVKDSTGKAYALVTGAPAAGQYKASAGVYTFAAADTGKSVAITWTDELIPQRALDDDSGWVLVGDAVELDGYCFPRGRGNVAVVYDAGYDAVPLEVDDAVVEMVAWKFRVRDHIGQTSKSLGDGGHVQFSQSDLPPLAQQVIINYARVGF